MRQSDTTAGRRRFYAKCVSGQHAGAERRIEEATRPWDDYMTEI